jgi:hypothetical protein
MSPVLLQDGSRPGKLTWAAQAIGAGHVAGKIFNPFCTPRTTLETPDAAGRMRRKHGAAACIDAIRDAGGDAYLDAATHGVFTAGANKFAVYDTWDLWPGARGVMTQAALRAHVDRMSQAATALGVQQLAPTLALDAPTGRTSELAYDMAEHAVAVDGDVYITIVGSPAFWASGGPLDAYIGELIQLRPAGWAIAATRESLRYPWPGLDPEEVAGMCRTSHSLSLRGPVIVLYGDLGALPFVAAGATHVGSGWDLQHRVCADDSFRSEPGIRRSSLRVTHRGLLASLKRPEAEGIEAADATLSDRLVPRALPVGVVAHWQHHLRVLHDRIARVERAGAGREDRVNELRRIYSAAARNFDRVVGLIGRMEAGRTQWIDPLSDGLESYAESEGW